MDEKKPLLSELILSPGIRLIWITEAATFHLFHKIIKKSLHTENALNAHILLIYV